MNNERDNYERALLEDAFYVVSSRYDRFSKSEKKIADCIMNDATAFLNCSITALSKRLDVSPATITRFCQKLNYSGFSELKYDITNNSTLLPVEKSTLDIEDKTMTIIAKLVKLQTDAIKYSLMHINPNVIRIAAKAICKAERVNIYAEGGPSSTGMYAYTSLYQLGINCQLFSDAQLALSSAMQLKSGDVAIYICRSGYSPTIHRTLRAAHRNRAKIVGITSNIQSGLALETDFVLQYSSLVENDMRYLHIARMCELAIIGVLYNDIIGYIPADVLDKVNNSSKAIAANQKYDE